jgi:hypothetical protein
MRRPIQTILAYAALVAPPFCGLLVILRFGQSLQPPRAIGGTWDLGGAACGLTGAPRIAHTGPRAEAPAHRLRQA